MIAAAVRLINRSEDKSQKLKSNPRALLPPINGSGSDATLFVYSSKWTGSGSD